MAYCWRKTMTEGGGQQPEAVGWVLKGGKLLSFAAASLTDATVVLSLFFSCTFSRAAVMVSKHSRNVVHPSSQHIQYWLMPQKQCFLAVTREQDTSASRCAELSASSMPRLSRYSSWFLVASMNNAGHHSTSHVVGTTDTSSYSSR